MLNDERPRFSIKDIGLVVSFTAAFVTQYMMLAKADADMDKRVAALESQSHTDDIAKMRRDIDRMTFVLCATDDQARRAACDQMEKQR
jgi:hypothetical protein